MSFSEIIEPEDRRAFRLKFPVCVNHFGAVAWAVAAVRSPGTRMRAVTEADHAAVVLHERIDLSRRLCA